MSPSNTSPEVAAAPARPKLRAETGFLAHVQALRAIAVLLVVIFHLWPAQLTGGFVGVDVFFGISGFLITGHLLREIESTGKVRLANFWARRIRRLLPAAFLVLGVSLAGTLLLMPTTVWRQITTSIGASALYVENWQLARDSVDYFASENIASPVQHYWSLSVEEQFYLVWPVLLLCAAALACRGDLIRFGRPARTVMVVVTAGSLVYSVMISRSAQSFGYFSTFAHAWEFGLGALMAILLRRQLSLTSLTSPARAVMSWLGFAMILWAGFTFTGDTLFPGYAALLPLGGAMLVIAGGHSPARWGPSRLVSWKPVQYTGNISYSLYLWHWPLIVLLPFVTGHELSGAEKVGVLAASFVLAGVTKVLVEDRFRSSRWLSSSKRRTFIDVVVTTGWTKEYPGGGSSQLMAQLAKGFSATWDRWAQGGRKVLAIRDVPFHPAQAVPDCIALSVNSVDPCSLSRPEADPTDPVDLALTADHTPNVHSLDLSSNFCDRTTCHFVVGGVITTRDRHHMTTTFANTLSPQIERAIDKFGG